MSSRVGGRQSFFRPSATNLFLIPTISWGVAGTLPAQTSIPGEEPTTLRLLPPIKVTSPVLWSHWQGFLLARLVTTLFQVFIPLNPNRHRLLRDTSKLFYYTILLSYLFHMGCSLYRHFKLWSLLEWHSEQITEQFFLSVFPPFASRFL